MKIASFSLHKPSCALLALVFSAGLLLAGTGPVAAAGDENESEHALGSASNVARRPLQELVGKPRAKGQVFVSIPQASMYGVNTAYQPFCSPFINVVNSSNETVEELILGIRYLTAERKDVGSTLSRFFRLKTGKRETEFFFSSVKASNCVGLVGEVEVVRCVYQNGDECTDDVRALAFGAVRLQLIEASKGKK
jgi:hypothetical protein